MGNAFHATSINQNDDERESTRFVKIYLELPRRRCTIFETSLKNIKRLTKVNFMLMPRYMTTFMMDGISLLQASRPIFG